jgi:hypothetical protein
MQLFFAIELLLDGFERLFRDHVFNAAAIRFGHVGLTPIEIR